MSLCDHRMNAKDGKRAGLRSAALPNSAKGHSIGASFTAKTFIYREAPPPEPVTSKKGATKPGGK